MRYLKGIYAAGKHVGLLAVGAAMGATLMAPVAAATLAPHGSIAATITQTRVVNCHGLAFYPVRSSSGYSSGGVARYGDGEKTTFTCDPRLPHRAVVTKVRFTVRDQSFYSQVSNCALGRSPLAAATAGTIEVMASVPATGAAEVPYTVRLETTSIQYPTINNGAYVYWLQCDVETVGGEQIFGADVTFTITQNNG